MVVLVVAGLRGEISALCGIKNIKETLIFRTARFSSHFLEQAKRMKGLTSLFCASPLAGQRLALKLLIYSS